MKVVFAKERIVPDGPTAFLAGPTPRSSDVPSWRPAAVAVFAELGFPGTLLLPEDRSGTFRGDYVDQVEWEWDGLDAADVVLFWVPRTADLPGFTTNVEFGLYARSGKVVLGAPPEAEKMTYLRWVAGRLGIPVFDSLGATVAEACVVAKRRSGLS